MASQAPWPAEGRWNVGADALSDADRLAAKIACTNRESAILESHACTYRTMARKDARAVPQEDTHGLALGLALGANVELGGILIMTKTTVQALYWAKAYYEQATRDEEHELAKANYEVIKNTVNFWEIESLVCDLGVRPEIAHEAAQTAQWMPTKQAYTFFYDLMRAVPARVEDAVSSTKGAMVKAADTRVPIMSMVLNLKTVITIDAIKKGFVERLLRMADPKAAMMLNKLKGRPKGMSVSVFDNPKLPNVAEALAQDREPSQLALKPSHGAVAPPHGLVPRQEAVFQPAKDVNAVSEAASQPAKDVSRKKDPNFGYIVYGWAKPKEFDKSGHRVIGRAKRFVGQNTNVGVQPTPAQKLKRKERDAAADRALATGAKWGIGPQGEAETEEKKLLIERYERAGYRYSWHSGWYKPQKRPGYKWRAQSRNDNDGPLDPRRPYTFMDYVRTFDGHELHDVSAIEDKERYKRWIDAAVKGLVFIISAEVGRTMLRDFRASHRAKALNAKAVAAAFSSDGAAWGPVRVLFDMTSSEVDDLVRMVCGDEDHCRDAVMFVESCFRWLDVRCEARTSARLWVLGQHMRRARLHAAHVAFVHAQAEFVVRWTKAHLTCAWTTDEVGTLTHALHRRCVDPSAFTENLPLTTKQASEFLASCQGIDSKRDWMWHAPSSVLANAAVESVRVVNDTICAMWGMRRDWCDALVHAKSQACFLGYDAAERMSRDPVETVGAVYRHVPLAWRRFWRTTEKSKDGTALTGVDVVAACEVYASLGVAIPESVKAQLTHLIQRRTTCAECPPELVVARSVARTLPFTTDKEDAEMVLAAAAYGLSVDNPRSEVDVARDVDSRGFALDTLHNDMSFIRMGMQGQAVSCMMSEFHGVLSTLLVALGQCTSWGQSNECLMRSIVKMGNLAGCGLHTDLTHTMARTLVLAGFASEHVRVVWHGSGSLEFATSTHDPRRSAAADAPPPARGVFERQMGVLGVAAHGLQSARTSDGHVHALGYALMWRKEKNSAPKGAWPISRYPPCTRGRALFGAACYVACEPDAPANFSWAALPKDDGQMRAARIVTARVRREVRGTRGVTPSRAAQLAGAVTHENVLSFLRHACGSDAEAVDVYKVLAFPSGTPRLSWLTSNLVETWLRGDPMLQSDELRKTILAHVNTPSPDVANVSNVVGVLQRDLIDAARGYDCDLDLRGTYAYGTPFAEGVAPGSVGASLAPGTHSVLNDVLDAMDMRMTSATASHGLVASATFVKRDMDNPAFKGFLPAGSFSVVEGSVVGLLPRQDATCEQTTEGCGLTVKLPMCGRLKGREMRLYLDGASCLFDNPGEERVNHFYAATKPLAIHQVAEVIVGWNTSGELKGNWLCNVIVTDTATSLTRPVTPWWLLGFAHAASRVVRWEPNPATTMFLRCMVSASKSRIRKWMQDYAKDFELLVIPPDDLTDHKKALAYHKDMAEARVLHKWWTPKARRKTRTSAGGPSSAATSAAAVHTPREPHELAQTQTFAGGPSSAATFAAAVYTPREPHELAVLFSASYEKFDDAGKRKLLDWGNIGGPLAFEVRNVKPGKNSLFRALHAGLTGSQKGHEKIRSAMPDGITTVGEVIASFSKQYKIHVCVMNANGDVRDHTLGSSLVNVAQCVYVVYLCSPNANRSPMDGYDGKFEHHLALTTGHRVSDVGAVASAVRCACQDVKGVRNAPPELTGLPQGPVPDIPRKPTQEGTDKYFYIMHRPGDSPSPAPNGVKMIVNSGGVGADSRPNATGARDFNAPGIDDNVLSYLRFSRVGTMNKQMNGVMHRKMSWYYIDTYSGTPIHKFGGKNELVFRVPAKWLLHNARSCLEWPPRSEEYLNTRGEETLGEFRIFLTSLIVPLEYLLTTNGKLDNENVRVMTTRDVGQCIYNSHVLGEPLSRRQATYTGVKGLVVGTTTESEADGDDDPPDLEEASA